MFFAHASETTTFHNKFMKMWQSVEIASHREIGIMLICKAKHLLYQSIYLLQKMGESNSKFDFERIVPVFLREPSRQQYRVSVVSVPLARIYRMQT